MPSPPLSCPGHTSRSLIRPLVPGDVPSLFETATEHATELSWRQLGTSGSLEAFAQRLWEDVHLQQVVCRRSTGEPPALVQLLRPSYRHGTVQLAMLVLRPYRTAVIPFEGLLLFLEQTFYRFPFRKIYAETSEMSFGAFRSGANRIFEVEGLLKDHEWHCDRYWSTMILSLRRESWTESQIRDRMLNSVGGSEAKGGRAR